MQLDLREVLRQWVGEMVDKHARGSERAFAMKVKIPQQNVNLILKDKKNVTPRQLAKIAVGLGMEASEVLHSIALLAAKKERERPPAVTIDAGGDGHKTIVAPQVVHLLPPELRPPLVKQSATVQEPPSKRRLKRRR